MEYVNKKYKQNNNNVFNHLIGPNFQEVNRLFVLVFENLTDRTSFSNYYSLFVLVFENHTDTTSFSNYYSCKKTIKW